MIEPYTHIKFPLFVISVWLFVDLIILERKICSFCFVFSPSMNVCIQIIVYTHIFVYAYISKTNELTIEPNEQEKKSLLIHVHRDTKTQIIHI